jgi:hypothetical protein
MLDLVELMSRLSRAAAGNARKSSSALPRNATGLDLIITFGNSFSTVAPS